MLRFLSVVALLGLAVFLLVDDGSHDGASAALGALVAAALVATVDLKRLLESAETAELSLGGAKFSMSRALGDAKRAEQGVVTEEVYDPDEASEPTSGEASQTLLMLRLRLERKLAYLAKHQLAEAGRPTFLNVGSLQYDGYLSLEQAATAVRILTWNDEALSRVGAPARKEFLASAGKLVANLRATVHANLIRKLVNESQWRVSPYRPEGTSRQYYRLIRRGRPDVCIAPVHAFDDRSANLRGAADRLAASAGDATRIIVVPDNAVVSPTFGAAEVVRLHALAERLQALAGL